MMLLTSKSRVTITAILILLSSLPGLSETNLDCKSLSTNQKNSLALEITCSSSAGVIFKKVAVGNKTAWLDVNRNMIFYVIYKNINSLNKAKTDCENLPTDDDKDWRLANGYPSSFNKKFNNKQSELLSLNDDGITEVMSLGEEAQWFWLNDSTKYYETITLNSTFGHGSVNYDYGSEENLYGAICIKENTLP